MILPKITQKKAYAVIAAALVLAALIYAAARVAGPGGGDRLQVTASFYPLYFLASEIGGNRVQASNLTPDGAAPHEYEPSPQDIARIQDGDLLFLNGADLEPWADNIDSVLGDAPVRIVTIGERSATLRVDADGQKVRDPHVWLSPPRAAAMAQRIFTAFAAEDPENQSYYEANAVKLIAELDTLHNAYRAGLRTCARRDIVTSHTAFAYLADEYYLRQVAVSGLSPEAEPSAEDIARAADFARQKGIRYIFFEKGSSPRLAETVAREVGAQTLELDPLESGTDYFAQMQANLENLRLALECQ